jgi:hypothetical protein
LCLEEKKLKKGRRGGVQASLLLRLGHGALQARKKRKKGVASSSFVKPW